LQKYHRKGSLFEVYFLHEKLESLFVIELVIGTSIISIDHEFDSLIVEDDIGLPGLLGDSLEGEQEQQDEHSHDVHDFVGNGFGNIGLSWHLKLLLIIFISL
jgi:hypothetical protein